VTHRDASSHYPLLHARAPEGLTAKRVTTCHASQDGWDAEDWQFAFEERAAILEYDEGLSRAEAEALAAQQIAEQRQRAAAPRPKPWRSGTSWAGVAGIKAGWYRGRLPQGQPFKDFGK